MKSVAMSLQEQVRKGLTGEFLAQLHCKKMDDVLRRWCWVLLNPKPCEAPGILGEFFAADRVAAIARRTLACAEEDLTEIKHRLSHEQMLNLVNEVLGNPSNRLGTYGTLSPGQINHHIVKALRGEWLIGTTYGRLQPHGWGNVYGFPAMVFDPFGRAIPIYVLESPDLPEGFESLDRFEGPEYQRVVLPIKLSDGTLCAAQVYVRSNSHSGQLLVR